VKLNKKKISFLISGKGSNLLEILSKNIKSNNFKTYSIVSNNLISKEIKNFIKKNIFDIEIYENTSKLKKTYFKGVDLIFSLGYMKIIDYNLIKNFDIINLHPSLLPNYKGLMTQKRMLINGESYFGFTIHKVSEQLDGGGIINQKSKKINTIDEHNLLHHHKKLEHQYVFDELIKYLN
tara:strand:+ start:1165 stop:1701 length:537 start_codon:yes stop_codon:yes gene_type:complete